MQGVEREGPRGINRHRFTPAEAAAEMERPVVKALHRLCLFRNKHKAFNGQARRCPCSDQTSIMERTNQSKHRPCQFRNRHKASQRPGALLCE